MSLRKKSFLAIYFCLWLSVVSVKAQIEDFSKINFKRADSVALLFPRHSLADIHELSLKLTESLPTDIEKFRAIYLWVCLNIENDFGLYIKNKKQREKLTDSDLISWNKKFSVLAMKILLNEHRTVCTGYAYLIRELAIHAGLSCEMIDGYGRTANANIGGRGLPNHSWNAIKLGHQWYLCDATWSSGAINMNERGFVKNYNNSYFLLSPPSFSLNHYPLDTAWMLMPKKPTLYEFLNRPLIYSSIFQNQIAPIFPETFNITVDKGSSILFRFKNNNQLKKIDVQLEHLGSLTSMHPEVKHDPDKISSFEITPPARGIFIVHVLADDNYAFTYRVEVK